MKLEITNNLLHKLENSLKNIAKPYEYCSIVDINIDFTEETSYFFTIHWGSHSQEKHYSIQLIVTDRDLIKNMIDINIAFICGMFAQAIVMTEEQENE